VQCDLLVINKFDLAPYVNVDLDRMVREAHEVRGGKPIQLTNCATGEGVKEVVAHFVRDVLFHDRAA
jgi:urease accessory protein